MVIGSSVARVMLCTPGIEDRDQLRQMMLDMGAVAFMSQYQQDPYPPGQGGGYRGAIRAVDRQSSTQTLFFGCIPQEDSVLNEVFGESTSFSEGPPLINSMEEWEEKFPVDAMTPT